MLLQAFVSRANANWAAPAFIALSIYVSWLWFGGQQRAPKKPMVWLWLTVFFGLLLSVTLIALPKISFYTQGPFEIRAIEKLRGWREAALRAKEIASENSFAILAEDRAMLRDFANASIDVYWMNPRSKILTKYVPKKGKVSGMFVPIPKIKVFQDATVIGFYGSNLMGIENEEEIKTFLQGLLKLREEVNHPLLHPKKELMVLTGGGPGIMEMGNRIAVELGILSGGNAVDLSNPPYAKTLIHNQALGDDINPYVQAMMTYRLEQIIYRQAEFHLDLPCILRGGTGTDFEFALENLRTQLGLREHIVPTLLFGTEEYWVNKITARYHQNILSGTIAGSEWVSNTFFLARNATEALDIYSRFFKGELFMGTAYKAFDRGFRLYNE
jgi:predicted Rossmann-fold nucleotide-binding protein